VSEKRLPETLIEAVQYFADIDVCTEFVAQLRWPTGPACPSCGDMEYSYLKTRRLWKCKSCKRQYSVKVGTIFEDSALPLSKWLPAIWLIANSKNGISSHELARSVGITQKSAWFVLHRIRLAMQTGSFEKLSGHVEADETYIGGKPRQSDKVSWGKDGRSVQSDAIHWSKDHKTTVFGAVERGGRVRAEVIPSDEDAGGIPRRTLEFIDTDSTLYTDEYVGYTRPGYQFDAHHTIRHADRVYVDGDVHTNSIEGFWSMLKRSIIGTYMGVSPAHLDRYIDEREYTYNTRDRDDLPRFAGVIEQISGRRVTYAELTGQI
jgi:transposase-like protein